MTKVNTFEGSLTEICKHIQISDCMSYTDDQQAIQNFIIEKMKARSADFKQAFEGLSLSGSYLDRLKIDAPDEFDMHIKLKMPFSITAVRDEERPGFMLLKASNRHEIVDNFLISNKKLQSWIRDILQPIIENISGLKCGGRDYTLEYVKRGYAVAHTILARSSDGREISFDFVPVFEFHRNEIPLQLRQKLNSNDYTVFAVPQPKPPKATSEYSFMLCAPHFERAHLHDKMNLKNSLRLMKKLRNALDIPHLTSYMLKSVYLMELDKHSDSFWQKPIGKILIYMLERLRECLQRKCIPFYLDESQNHLSRLSDIEIVAYEKKVANALQQLKQFEWQSSVDCNRMERFFGIKN